MNNKTKIIIGVGAAAVLLFFFRKQMFGGGNGGITPPNADVDAPVDNEETFPEPLVRTYRYEKSEQSAPKKRPKKN